MTLRRRHSTNVPAARHVRQVEIVRRVAALSLTTLVRSRVNREAIRLNVVQAKVRAAMASRGIANCPLAAEAHGRFPRFVQRQPTAKKSCKAK